MKTALRAGEVIETATPAEVRHEVHGVVSEWFQEQARGVLPWRFDSAPVTVSGGKVTIPGTGDNQCGPNPGFCVMVHAIRIVGLASGDLVSVYRNSTSGELVDQDAMGATGTLLKLLQSSKALFLGSGEKLIFTGSSLTATGDITITCEGSEVPAPDAYKLLT